MAVTVKIPAQLRTLTAERGRDGGRGQLGRRGARRALRALRRPARPHHRGRRAAPLRQRLRGRRGHPLRRGPRHAGGRRRRDHDPARRRRRLLSPEAPGCFPPGSSPRRSRRRWRRRRTAPSRQRSRCRSAEMAAFVRPARDPRAAGHGHAATARQPGVEAAVLAKHFRREPGFLVLVEPRDGFAAVGYVGRPWKPAAEGLDLASAEDSPHSTRPASRRSSWTSRPGRTAPEPCSAPKPASTSPTRAPAGRSAATGSWSASAATRSAGTGYALLGAVPLGGL